MTHTTEELRALLDVFIGPPYSQQHTPAAEVLRLREENAELTEERDRLRLTVRNVRSDLHEIQAGDLSPCEALAGLGAALGEGGE